MKNEWSEGLTDFTDQHINEAIKICRTSKEYPPTLPQFVDFCRQVKRREEFNPPKDNCRVANPAVALHYLDKMKELISTKK